MKPEMIHKIHYVRECGFYIVGRGFESKTTYDLYSNGKVTVTESSYDNPGQKKVSKKQIQPEEFRALAEDILTCFHNAESFEMCVDDCDESLTLTFDGGKLVIDRGVSDGKRYIDDIMYEFFEKHDIGGEI